MSKIYKGVMELVGNTPLVEVVNIEQQEKLKALEAQKTEAENLEIVQMVRAVRMTPSQLNALLSGGMVPGRAVGSANPEQEEMTHEE